MALSDELHAYIVSVEDRPFRWGVHDCCTFAARCVEIMTGHNPAAGLSYRSEAEAEAILQAHGGLVPLIDTLLGERVGTPRPLDIVVVDNRAGLAAGVCFGDWAQVCGRRGLVRVPIAEVIAAWSVL